MHGHYYAPPSSVVDETAATDAELDEASATAHAHAHARALAV